MELELPPPRNAELLRDYYKFVIHKLRQRRVIPNKSYDEIGIIWLPLRSPRGIELPLHEIIVRLL